MSLKSVKHFFLIRKTGCTEKGQKIWLSCMLFTIFTHCFARYCLFHHNSVFSKKIGNSRAFMFMSLLKELVGNCLAIKIQVNLRIFIVLVIFF